MKKTIIFYSLITLVVILAASEMNVFTITAFVASVIALGSFACSMTSKELTVVSGAEFFNNVFNTNDFTEE